jgi:UDP-glucose 4-epimerase
VDRIGRGHNGPISSSFRLACQRRLADHATSRGAPVYYDRRMTGDEFRDKCVLITGGLGFIGSTLACRLVSLGARVTVLDSLIPEYGGNLFNLAGVEAGVRINVSDVRDAHSMRYLVQEQDYLFNLAGQTSHFDSMEDPYTDLDINCRAQLSILEACRKHNSRIKIVFASTRQMYGVPDRLPVTEDHLLRPVDVNGINKMAGEWYHILYNNVYGLRACSLRLTNTYGPRMLVKNSRQTAIGWFMRQILDDEEVQLFGDGSQLRDFTYVDDAADAFLRAGASDVSNGQIFNLGSDETINLRDLAALMVEVNGGGQHQVVPFPSDRKAIDIGDYYADFGRIRAELGWEPRVPLKDGLARTLAYYRKYLPHYL